MWYVLHIKTGQETEVSEALGAKGYLAAVPREERLVRKGGGWTTKEYTLMPGYVFINLDYSAEDYYKVREVPGVLRFLGADARRPSTLTALEAEWIRILSRGGKPLEPSAARLGEDGELHLVDGVLLNFPTRLLKLDRRTRRAKVELSVCGEKKIMTLSFKILNEE